MQMRLGSAALAELSDDELVARFQSGDNDSLDVLLQRYRRFTRAKARGYFLIGADSEEIERAEESRRAARIVFGGGPSCSLSAFICVHLRFQTFGIKNGE